MKQSTEIIDSIENLAQMIAADNPEILENAIFIGSPDDLARAIFISSPENEDKIKSFYNVLKEKQQEIKGFDFNVHLIPLLLCYGSILEVQKKSYFTGLLDGRSGDPERIKIL